MATTYNPNPTPDWEAVAAFFGLDTSFQYTAQQRAAHTKAFLEAQNDTPEAALCAFWAAWCHQQGLTCVSADEMLVDGQELTIRQSRVAKAFSALWDLALDVNV